MRELATAKRPLVLGVGGGGDVVGALAVAEHCRLFHGASPIVGGVTWERAPIDPDAGPRRAHEVDNGVALAAGVPTSSTTGWRSRPACSPPAARRSSVPAGSRLPSRGWRECSGFRRCWS